MTKVLNTNTAQQSLKRRVEDLTVINAIEKVFKEKRGYIIKKPKPNEPVLACMSGGLDSICNITVLLEELKVQVYPFFLDREQTNYKYEKASVMFFNKYFKKRYPDLYHDVLEIKLVSPAWAYKDMLRDTHKMKDNLIYRHDVAYPARNSIIFLTGMDYGYALQSRGIFPKTVFGATLSSDFLYHSSLTSIRITNLLMCNVTGDWDWQYISIPIEKEFANGYDKDVYVKFNTEKNIPLEKTRSCPKKSKIQCGTCLPCWDRRMAFKKIGIKDKTPYLKSLKEEIPKEYL